VRSVPRGMNRYGGKGAGRNAKFEHRLFDQLMQVRELVIGEIHPNRPEPQRQMLAAGALGDVPLVLVAGRLIRRGLLCHRAHSSRLPPAAPRQ
jgi:hypothetical protein